MKPELERARPLLGDEGLKKLESAHVAVFGLGGVGSYAAEALVRAGVGTLSLFDGDTVAVSNLNRQLFATQDSIGMYKTDAARARLERIMPNGNIHTYPIFFTPENADTVDFSAFDYVIDAVDMLTAKVAIAVAAQASGTPVISSMGTGNKLDPTAFRVADITKTRVCPLARAMRTALKKAGVPHLLCVYSEELPAPHSANIEEEDHPTPAKKKRPPASLSFVPPVAGMILAGEAIKTISGIKQP